MGSVAIPALANILQVHSKPEIRASVVRWLGWMGRGAIPSLVKAVQADADPRVRGPAARSLAEIEADDETAIAALAKALKDPDAGTQKEAAYALSVIIKKPSPAAKATVPDLITALQVQDSMVQAHVARALGSTGKDAKDAVPVLIDVLQTPSKYKFQESSNFGALQRNFIFALGATGTGDPSAVSVMSSILKDKSRKSFHESAITALGELGVADRAAVPILVSKLKSDSDKYEQSHIAHALAGIQPDGITALLQIFQNPRETEAFRLITCDAIGKVINQDKRILLALREALRDPQLGIRACAANNLASMGEATEVVLSLLLENALIEEKAWEAEKSLKNLGSKSVPTLINLLQHPKSKVRESAAEILGQLRLKPAEAKPAIEALVALLRREIINGADYRRWRQEGNLSYTYPVPVAAAFEALRHFGPYTKQALPDIMSWMTRPDSFIRLKAIEVLGGIGTSAKSAKTKLIEALKDTEPSVQVASAQALLDIGFELGELDPIFTTVVIDDYINELLEKAYDKMADDLRPSSLVSGPDFQLPEFPWPNPPTPAHIAIFGREIPREFLGTDSTILRTVYQRIFQALVQTDPNFESGIFGVPGGFALLAKTERINEDGTPLPGEYRWAQGYVPPLNFGEYVGQLFFEKPGYFRVIAFVITTEEYRPQEPSNKALPRISEGATDLPEGISNESFYDKKAYLLVYSFKRFRGGRVTDFKISSLSAVTHLEKSGVMKALLR
jgi:HEAT repeat protein